ncbi:IS1 family transposase [Lewinellaceae bacterium SD302]|nr:IS1 family transposase [Lewinellaceae bacterium SD302]
MNELRCPRCLSSNIIKNGRTHYGKQNHKCKDCSRQFVNNSSHYITEDVRGFIKNSLMERCSLRGICRIFGISRTWLFAFARSHWLQTPSDLGFSSKMESRCSKAYLFGIQADEMWSFVQRRVNKQWIWVIYDPEKQITISCYIGDRSEKSAKVVYQNLPEMYRDITVETDDWPAYGKVIPKNLHRVGKEYTYFIEGYFAGVRARCSRLVRKALSFSKSEYWHQMAVRWCLWQMNLERHPYI